MCQGRRASGPAHSWQCLAAPPRWPSQRLCDTPDFVLHLPESALAVNLLNNILCFRRWRIPPESGHRKWQLERNTAIQQTNAIDLDVLLWKFVGILESGTKAVHCGGQPCSKAPKRGCAPGGPCRRLQGTETSQEWQQAACKRWTALPSACLKCLLCAAFS